MPATMSAEDVQLVTRWFAGLSRGEVLDELCHPEIVIRNWDESPLRGPYEGHEGLERWWQDFAEVIEDARFELLETIDLDDGRVLTVQRLGGTFRLTGIELADAKWAAITTVRDGKIAEAQGYASPGKGKKAAGLPKPA
jgi:ketosteroid isomerase-like protein